MSTRHDQRQGVKSKHVWRRRAECGTEYGPNRTPATPEGTPTLPRQASAEPAAPKHAKQTGPKTQSARPSPR